MASTQHPVAEFTDLFAAEGKPYLVPEKFAAAMHLQLHELARLAGVHPSILAANPANSRLQSYLHDALAVMTAAYELCVDRSRAMYWFRNVPLPEYHFHKAEELVASGRADTVLAHIDQMRSGSSG